MQPVEAVVTDGGDSVEGKAPKRIRMEEPPSESSLGTQTTSPATNGALELSSEQ